MSSCWQCKTMQLDKLGNELDDVAIKLTALKTRITTLLVLCDSATAAADAAIVRNQAFNKQFHLVVPLYQ